MPNITYFTDHKAKLENIKGVQQNAENYIDFSKYPATAADTVQLIAIPAGAIVDGIDIVTVTAEGQACTMDVGDGSTATLFDSNVSLNTTDTHTGTDPATEATLAATNGKYYATAGYIVGTIEHNASTAAFYISAKFRILNIAHA